MDNTILFEICREFVNKTFINCTIKKVSINTQNIRKLKQQDFFNSSNSNPINKILDTINRQLGYNAVSYANAINSSEKTIVIPPSWQPNGPKRLV